MTTPGAPMPPALRTLFSERHPARNVDCPWCKARAGKPCVVGKKRRPMNDTHPARQEAYSGQQQRETA
jgi:hypothetical protein